MNTAEDVTSKTRFGSNILAMVSDGLLRFAEAQRLDGDQLLSQAKLSRSQLINPDGYVPIDKHIALGYAITKRLGSVNGGLHSGAAIFGDPRGALGFAVRRAGRHAVALERFCRFISVVNETAHLETRSTPRGLELHVDMLTELAMLGHPTEALLSSWVSIARFATQVRWVPVLVTFLHQPWGSEDEHHEFFGCPVQFGSTASSLTIDEATALLPIEPTLHPLDSVLDNLERNLCERSESSDSSRLMGALRGGGLKHASEYSPDLVNQAAGLMLTGNNPLPMYEVAFLLGLPSVRTLKSRLAEADLLDPRHL